MQQIKPREVSLCRNGYPTDVMIVSQSCRELSVKTIMNMNEKYLIPN